MDSIEQLGAGTAPGIYEVTLVRSSRCDAAMDTERRHLRRVEAGERLPVPADDLEFLDDNAGVNAAGLRQELNEMPRGQSLGRDIDGGGGVAAATGAAIVRLSTTRRSDLRRLHGGERGWQVSASTGTDVERSLYATVSTMVRRAPAVRGRACSRAST